LDYLGSVRHVLEEYDSGNITATDPDNRNSNSGTELPYLTNGNLSDRYTTTTAVGTIDPYEVFRFQLASSQTVAFVDLEQVALSSGTSTEFVVQYGPNGSTWTTASTSIYLDTNQRDYRVTIDAAATYIRFVRVGSTDLSTAVVSLSECNVYTESSTISATKCFAFEFNDEQEYLLVMSDQNIAVYSNADYALKANILSPYTTSQISEVNYTQANDYAVFFHKDVNSHELARQGADDRWSLNSIAFENIPQFEFTENNSTPTGTLTPSATEGIITLTASAGTPFASATAGQRLVGNGGVARILSTQSSTVVNAVTIFPFYNTNAIASGEWTYEQGWEDAWSSSRGYPRAGCFFEQRLVMGGLKSLPFHIAASVIQDYYNFDEGTLNANEAFIYPLNDDKANVIYHLYPHNILEIYTSGGIFVSNTDKEFTPTTTKITRQVQLGAEQSIPPQEVQNGGTLFVQKDGSSIEEFIYQDETLSYETRPLSLLSSHLINDPVDATLRRATTSQEANYYLQVNSNGNLIVGCLLANENIAAFTEHETDGNFKNVEAVDDEMYAVVERTINGTAVRYLERFNFDRTTDSNIYLELGDSQLDTKNYATGSITPSAPNGGTAANVNDGDLTTYLETTTNISTTDDYVAFLFDLGSNQSVDYIWLRNISLTSGSTNEFQIEYSTDNFSSDINVASKTISLSTTEISVEVPIGSSTRYIRLIRNGTTDLSTAKLKIAEATVYLDKDATVSGLDYLEGKSVWTIIDGSVYGPETVSSGSITLDANVFTDIEIGLNYTPTVITNPIEFPQAGPLMGKAKSFNEMVVNLYQTQHILVQGYNPIKEVLGNSSSTTLGSSPTLHTQRYRMLGFRGWDELGQVTITQNYPLRMTLLNLYLEYNVGNK